jgi:pyruvate carboxylase
MTSQTSLGDLVSEFERTSLDFWFESSRFDWILDEYWNLIPPFVCFFFECTTTISSLALLNVYRHEIPGG